MGTHPIAGQTIPFVGNGRFLCVTFFINQYTRFKTIYTRLRIHPKWVFLWVYSVTLFFNLYSPMSMTVTLLFLSFYVSHLASICYSTYYMFWFMLMFSISLVMSTLSQLEMYTCCWICVECYWFVGVLWPISLLSNYPLLMKFMKVNPVYYLIGYRAAFFEQNGIYYRVEIYLAFW